MTKLKIEKMKKTIITLAVIAGFNTAVLAQEVTATPGTAKATKKELNPEEKSKKGANHAEKKLGLTAQQKADWEVAALKRALVNQPLHEKLKGSTTPEERQSIHKEIKANNDAFETSVNFFLTAEQKTKFASMKEERLKAKKKEMKKNFNEAHVDYGD
ncbi:MAG: hypothetical protein SGJ15_13115 [Bacteroidota bacterium]|nr:hypothetical protein [Bacteroidota bacterium]